MGHNFLEGGRKFDCCNEIILLEIFFTSTTSPSQYVSPYHSHRQVSLSWDRLANEEILAPIYSVFHLLQTACYLSMLLLFYYQKKKGEIPRQQCQAARLSDMCFSLYSYIYIIRLYLCWLPSRLCPDTQQHTYEQETQNLLLEKEVKTTTTPCVHFSNCLKSWTTPLFTVNAQPFDQLTNWIEGHVTGKFPRFLQLPNCLRHLYQYLTTICHSSHWINQWFGPKCEGADHKQ